MGKRIVVGVLLAALFVAVLYFSGIVQGVALTLFALLSVHEMGGVYRAKGVSPFLWSAYAFAALFYAARAFLGAPAQIALFFLCVFAVFAERVFNKNRNTQDTLLSLAVFVYPLALYAILIENVANPDYAFSRTAMFLMFAGPLLGDTFAYFFGTFFGKRKLCPHLSPNKTVAGSIGGLVGGIVGGLLSYYVQLLFHGAFPLHHMLILGLLMGATGQIGDLFASSVKRWAQVKDFGRIFPGHGGTLDRLDSVLMCAPMAYVYFSLICGIQVW
ncbi:MAG TPA: CDP-archaeol synthase [Clostridia bacterium]|nr:CDP-archaeol synthase [Clostridia bacterium]